MKRFAPFAAGLVFGIGLVLSGMTSPARVLSFLDVTGKWNPALGFVMAAALVVAAPLFALARRRTPEQAVLVAGPIDTRLVAGAALFGIGWGVAGLCPGPALVDLVIRPWPTLAFVLPLVAGLLMSRRD